MINFKGV